MGRPRALGTAIGTCRQQPAHLSRGAHSFSVSRAHTCQENTSLIASSFRSCCRFPEVLGWPGRFSPHMLGGPFLQGHTSQGFQPQVQESLETPCCTPGPESPGTGWVSRSPALKGAPRIACSRNEWRTVWGASSVVPRPSCLFPALVLCSCLQTEITVPAFEFSPED